jgi:Ca2+-binding RTX toxin-like protein
MRAIPIILTLVSSAAVALPMTPANAAPTLCDGKVATVVGTPGNDVLHGTPERDVIAGLGGNDRVLAGDGNDVICGGDGADRLFGEDGNDVLFAGKARWIDNRAGSGYQPDRLDGGPGDDFLEIGSEPVNRGLGISGVITFGTAPAGVVVDVAERSAAGDGDDTIVPRGGLRIVGTSFDDVLRGSEFNEELQGLGGADTIDGRGGSDHLYGDGATPTTEGSDDDLISGGAGKDVVLGTIGGDTLRGGADLDEVRATGEGRNRVFGGVGDDFLEIRMGTEIGAVVDGALGRDNLTLDADGPLVVRMLSGTVATGGQVIGTIDRTEIVSAADAVTMDFYGTPGPDSVYAGAHGRLRAWTFSGPDVIRGSTLADLIDAGRGVDDVRGGPGRDTCLHAEERGGCELPSP